MNDQTWEQLTRSLKEDWVRREPDPDLPPVVVVERPAGTALAMVVAPWVDRDLGLKAAAMLRQGFDAARIILITDTYRIEGEGALPPLLPGELQRRFEGGERHGAIREALWCMVATAEGIEGVSLPYVVLSKTVDWSQTVIYGTWDGDVPRALSAVMRLAPLTASPEIVAAARSSGVADPERQLFHAGRGTLGALTQAGYRVFDLVSPRHPE